MNVYQKGKVKLLLCSITHYTTKTYWWAHILNVLNVAWPRLYLLSSETLIYLQPAISRKWEWAATEIIQIFGHHVQHILYLLTIMNSHHETLRCHDTATLMTPGILNLGTRWRWMVSFTSQPHYPDGMIHFPFERLYSLYSQSGHCRWETIPCPYWESNPAPSDIRITALWQGSVISNVTSQ